MIQGNHKFNILIFIERFLKCMIPLTGKKNGFATKLKESSPFCISIHCLAHRLNLATSQAADGVPYLREYQQILTSLYSYFHKSTARGLGLQSIQRVLDLPQIKIKEVYEVRWFAFFSALEAVFKSWLALVTFFRDKTKKTKKKSDNKSMFFNNKIE